MYLCTVSHVVLSPFCYCNFSKDGIEVRRSYFISTAGENALDEMIISENGPNLHQANGILERAMN